MLDGKQIAFFKENGYLHIRSCVSKESVANFRDSFFSHLNFLFDVELEPDFDSELLGPLINKLRRQDGKRVQHFYQTAKLLSSYQELFHQDNVKDVVGALLEITSDNAIIAEHQFRFDVPNDTEYLHGWHQDSAYYPQDPTGLNSLVLNVSLHHVSPDMGSPELAISSHKEGSIDFSDNTGKQTSIQQYNVCNDIVSRFPIKSLDVQCGDVVVYHMNTIHKSGFNSSSKVRFSAIARAFNALTITSDHSV